MTYALVRNSVIEQVGPPRLWFDGSRWWDFRPADPATYAAAGWLPVTESERPPDTATTTSDMTYELIDGLPCEVWTVRDWTQAELDQQALSAAQQELAYAVQVNAAPEELAAVNAAALTAEGIAEGDPWAQPSGAQDAYPIYWVVTHNGKMWESTVAANVWEPGVSGWRETGSEWPDWVQPTGAHDAYPEGAQVTHIEQHWLSLVDGNVWEPPTQWTAV